MTAAIILAGGRASRLGGAAKPLLEVGGRTLLDHALAAVADCHPIVVVGPAVDRPPVDRPTVVGPPVDRPTVDIPTVDSPTELHNPSDIVWTRETPPFGGPVAAIVAGLAHVDSAEVYLLAADLPNAEAAVALLRQHAPLEPAEDGLCLTDAAGRMQWLIGRYRTAALRTAVAALPDAGRDASVRSLLAGLTLTTSDAGEVATDVDTWDDLERARATTPALPDVPGRGRRPTAEEETT